MDSFNAINSSFVDSLKDPRKLQQYVRKNAKDLIQWGAFAALSVCVYLFFSSGDFSFILTFSSLVQTFGFCLLTIKVKNSRSISGLSRNTVICYSICILSRLVSILNYDGYLPYDETGDLIYRVSEVITFVCCGVLLYMSFFSFKHSYDWELDSLRWYYFTVPTFVIAVLFHPSLNPKTVANIAWTFALYLESASMLPQLNVFRKKGGEIESYTSHYVASQTISRILSFVFWACSFSELNEVHGRSSFLHEYVGYFVLLAQILQIALTGDFLYFYITSIKQGIPLQLPSYVI